MIQKKDPVIAVVCGGPSAEAEVSRVSGREVARALKACYPQVVTLELDSEISVALREHRVDVVFPALHGPRGEDGTFQGLLEILKIPYVGSGVAASAFAMNKTVAKLLFSAAGLAVADDIIIERHEESTADRILKKLGARVVIKPTGLGSALGVSMVGDSKDLEKALALAFQYDSCVLVEKWVEGKEISVAILEKEGIEALPVIEIKTPEGTWYDYEHRYTSGLSEHKIPAELPREQYERTQEVAKRAFQVLGARDLARVDFIVPERGEPVLLELNSIPGMTPTSLYPDAARSAGISFEALVNHLVDRKLSKRS